ncbi:hypothetical protein PG985_008857 [Apiospora marii]|uniref:Uncharacterized protein n=1 Tax=Apiospora marii TaxID=335849 RepID=A0ABR1RCD8_9PEZI
MPSVDDRIMHIECFNREVTRMDQVPVDDGGEDAGPDRVLATPSGCKLSEASSFDSVHISALE